jgi:hypothetical protein
MMMASNGWRSQQVGACGNLPPRFLWPTGSNTRVYSSASSLPWRVSNIGGLHTVYYNQADSLSAGGLRQGAAQAEPALRCMPEAAYRELKI